VTLTSGAPGGEPFVRPGDVLGGKYTVERTLGSGAMGLVVAARHRLVDQRVAVKLLFPSLVRSEETARRFLLEARAAIQIQNEHVVRVLDVGKLEDDTPYLVMEYLEGTDLANVLRMRGVLPVREAVDYVLQALQAVAEAHRLGIVHRDLKPANLFLAEGSDGAPLRLGDRPRGGRTVSGRSIGVSTVGAYRAHPDCNGRGAGAPIACRDNLECTFTRCPIRCASASVFSVIGIARDLTRSAGAADRGALRWTKCCEALRAQDTG
jgi:serine/threonine protein kinase